jgi:nucleoside-diphosphate-sugar epimerase
MTAVFITGAGGGLGRKLIARLLATDWCTRIVAADITPPTDLDDGRVEPVAGSLLDPGGAWRQAMAGCDAVVHFAAQNPHTDASWADCAASIDMTLGVFDAAAAHGAGRVIFASSNHVMGGYKDEPLARPEPGFLTQDLDPSPGTRWHTGREMMDSTAYAAAKLAGERALVALTRRAPGLTGINVRIGWVQPGDNRPHTINISGDAVFDAADVPQDADGRRDLSWYRNMWMSNRDFAALFVAALKASAQDWPERCITVNGVSRNRGTGWDLTAAERLVGYRPQDDLYAAMGL